jgi:hypothetical protein
MRVVITWNRDPKGMVVHRGDKMLELKDPRDQVPTDVVYADEQGPPVIPYLVGEIVDLPTDEAERLIKRGMAHKASEPGEGG